MGDKKNITIILILGAFMALGFYLRVYHLDYPSIGYHNMKENEYLSQAIHQYRDGDYLRRVQHIFGVDDGPGYFEEYPQMPILPWMIVISWKLFGVHFWAARMIIILFSIATIPLVYLVTKKLTENKYTSVLAAFFFTIMPITIFFGRNIQPETPALFTTMLGFYFYLKWLDNQNIKSVIYLALAFAVTALLKYTFLIGLIPMLAIFPFRLLKQEIYQKQVLRHVGIFLLIMTVPVTLWTYVSKLLNTKETLMGVVSGRVDLLRVFSGEYWTIYSGTIIKYLDYNYTFLFVCFTLWGLIFIFVKKEERLTKFMYGYLFALLPYSMILADFIKAHSYYQMPFVPIVLIGSAYFFFVIGSKLNEMIKHKYARYLPLILIVSMIPELQNTYNRHWNTVYFGLDVSAGYLKEQTSEDTRFWLFGWPPSVATCYLADRRCGFIGIPDKLDDFIEIESSKNMNWALIHWPIDKQELKEKRFEIYQYIQENYEIQEITYLENDGELGIKTIVLKKGGSSNLEDFNQNNWIDQLGGFVKRNYIYELKGEKSRELMILEKVN